MSAAVKQYISNKMYAMIMMPPLKREVIRLIICGSLALVLNGILYAGVESDGTIKHWAEKPLQIFASPAMFAFMTTYFLPLLFWTVLKAILLSANNAFSGILSFLGNLLTGAMYCSGLVLASVSLKQYTISGSLDTEMASVSVLIFLMGLIYFYILQCAIQQTPTPSLLAPAASRKQHSRN